MAAKVFEIIGTVAVILAIFVAAVVLPFVAKFLKKTHKSIREMSSGLRDQVGSSITNIDTAQDQLDAFAAASASVRAGMDSALAGADKAITFLKSGAFQVGLPIVLWTLFLLVALPKGLRSRKKKKKIEPIPPPSWEQATER
jgi:hypothetical protein